MSANGGPTGSERGGADGADGADSAGSRPSAGAGAGAGAGSSHARRALVTGGTGFLGSALVRALLADGWAVRCLARPGSDRTNLVGVDVEVVDGDLGDRGSLERALAGADALFHCAAAYQLWARDPGDLYRANVDGTRAILEAALARGIEDIVYTSSVAVLRPPKPGEPPTDESADPRLEDVVGHYKRSKVLAERVVRDLCRERGLRARIVLPSTPIGPRDVKPTPTGQMVLDFLQGKMPGYVDTGLNLVDVDDCARGHLLALARGRVGERYILGNENLTLRDILFALADLTGLPRPRLRIPYGVAWLAGACSTGLARLRGRPPSIPLDGVRMSRKHMWFDPSRARRELGFPATPAREALAKAARWFCEAGRVRPDRARTALATLAATGK